MQPTTASAGPGPHSDPADQPLNEVIDARSGHLADIGEGQFQTVAGGQVLCLTCREREPAVAITADDIDRVEGASDPADATLLLPVRCPSCTASGVLVVRYGPEASEDEADLLVDLRRAPRDQGRPPRS